MKTERIRRHLAAILYADVVGFSRMSEMDEENTFLNVREYLDHFAKTIEAYHGQVIKYAGDAVLAIFDSASDALICAARVQIDMHQRNKSLDDDRKICFRIGLNLGDVIKDRGDIFGDGVNVAARLEALGQPGGICVGGSFYDAVVMKLPFDFEFMGEQQVKNITKPIRAYHAKFQQEAELPLPYKDKIIPDANKVKFIRFLLISFLVVIPLSLILWFTWAPLKDHVINNDIDFPKDEVLNTKNKKTIIILPFDNMGSDSKQISFADGMTEDLITDLSQLSNLRVLARNTSFRFKGKVVDPIKIGKELKVKYLLEGSIRKSGDKLRVNAQLIDTENGYHVWSSRYDRKLVEVFDVQDELTRNIVNALAIELTEQEETSLARVSTNNFQAYEHFLRGQKFARERTRESYSQAEYEFKEAIKLDETYARSFGALAILNIRMYTSGWTESPSESRNRALHMAKKAVALNNTLPQLYWSLGFVHLFRNEFTLAAKAVEKSITIAPSYADGYALLALIKNRLGDADNADDAIRLIKKGMKLNPHYTWDYPYNLGHAYYNKGQYKIAIEFLQKALERNANAIHARLFLAASYSGLDMQDDAEWEIEQVLTINPMISISHMKSTSSIVNNKTMKTYVTLLRKAGLPEK